MEKNESGTYSLVSKLDELFLIIYIYIAYTKAKKVNISFLVLHSNLSTLLYIERSLILCWMEI